MNQIAYIDLSEEQVTVKRVPDELRRRFLGGRGINMYLLYNHTEKGSKPLAPDSPLIFGAGLLTGVLGMGTSRYNVSGRSPQSGLIGDSNAGGFFGPELRYAGFDHLLITGAAKEPVYLWIKDGNIEFRPAKHLASMETVETMEALRNEVGDPNAQMAIIGPAGRNTCVQACIMNSINDANGHTGMGALMGSKKLWAVVVRGTQGIPVNNPTKVLITFDKLYKQVTARKGFKATALYGTIMRLGLQRTMATVEFPGDDMLFTGKDELDLDKFIDEYQYTKASCFSCPMHCKHVHTVKKGPWKGRHGGGPEFQDANGFGARQGVWDWDYLLTSGDLCNDYGVDKMADTYVSWAIELFTRGFIDEEVTGGYSLRWGEPEGHWRFLRELAYREGFGGIFADGVKKASRRLFGKEGAQYEKYFPTIKGENLEQVSNYKIFVGQALGAATATLGSSHLRSRYTIEEFGLPADVLEKTFGRPVPPEPEAYEGKAWPVIWHEHMCAATDSLGMCRFFTKWLTLGFLAFDEFTEVIESATGMALTPKQVFECGERVWNLERMFLNREGVARKDDWHPDIVFDEPIKSGPFQGRHLERDKFSKLLDEYYQEHGWDSNGVPTPETLERLGLNDEPSHLL